VTGWDLNVEAIVAWQQLYHVRLRDVVLLCLERAENLATNTHTAIQQELDDIIRTTRLQVSLTNHVDL
jgi:hypothetical protein